MKINPEAVDRFQAPANIPLRAYDDFEHAGADWMALPEDTRLRDAYFQRLRHLAPADRSAEIETQAQLMGLDSVAMQAEFLEFAERWTSDATGEFRPASAIPAPRPAPLPAVVIPPASPSVLLSSITAGDLLKKEIPATKWAFDGLLPEGLTILAGAPKLGKSWMALDWALSVALGTKAMGEFDGTPGTAVVLALEDSEGRLQGRLQALLNAAGLPPNHPGINKLILTTIAPRSGTGDFDLGQLRQFIDQAGDVRLLVVDTLGRVSPEAKKKENEYDHQLRALAPLQRLGQDCGLAVLGITHLRKMGATDPIDQVNGSVAIAGTADGILVLKRSRGEKQANLLITGRDIQEREVALRFDCPVWVVEGDAADVNRSRERNDIIAAIKELARRGIPATPKKIAIAADLKPDVARKRLSKMLRSGEVYRTTDGTYGKPVAQ